ncbi:YciI family protein [Nesterenkonia suensis]
MTERTATHLLIHRFIPGTGPQDGTEELAEEMRAWEVLDTDLRGSGHLLDGVALHEHTVRLGVGADDAAEAQDPQDRSIIFAVHVIAAADDAEAHAIAERMPHLEYGSTEIRPVMRG